MKTKIKGKLNLEQNENSQDDIKLEEEKMLKNLPFPHSLINITILSTSQLMFHHNVSPVNLPFVRLRTERKHRRFIVFGRRIQKLSNKTIGHHRMVMNQFG